MTTAATEIVHYRNICQAPGCDRDATVKYMPGHCTMHAQRLRKYGSLELPPRPPKAPKPSCAVEDCTRPYCSRGMCSMHIQRQRKYGDPGEVAGRLGRPKPPCAVEGCDRPRREVSGPGAGLCSAHGKRVRRTGDVGPAAIQRGDRSQHQVAAALDRACTVAGCDRPRRSSRFYCSRHYQRVRTYGSTELPQPDRTCAAPDCERTDHVGYGYCNLHYQRMLRYGTTELPQIDRTCVVPECERTDQITHGYCNLHRQRVRKYGDPLVVRAGFGENSPRWLGDDASYETMHQRIRAKRGRASTLLCVDCGGPAREWAYTGQGGDAERIDRHGLRYSLDVVDYEPMCKRCHQRLDARPRPIASAQGPREPYRYAHNRVHCIRGRASAHPCVDCGGPAQEWAYNNAGGESDRVVDVVRGDGVYAVHFSINVADYDPMCKPCHRHRDALYRAQCARERRP